MKVILPKVWFNLIEINLSDDTPKRPIGVDVENNDPTPYQNDQRTIVVCPDQDTPEEWVDIRLTSGDMNYWMEAVSFDDGHEVDAVIFDIHDKQIGVKIRDGSIFTIEIGTEA